MKKFSEWKVGDTINHKLTKTIFESDNNLFSLLTMNHHPVHTNQEYPKEAKHGKIFVNGMLTLSLAVRITVPEITLYRTFWFESKLPDNLFWCPRVILNWITLLSQPLTK